MKTTVIDGQEVPVLDATSVGISVIMLLPLS